MFTPYYLSHCSNCLLCNCSYLCKGHKFIPIKHNVKLKKKNTRQIKRKIIVSIKIVCCLVTYEVYWFCPSLDYYICLWIATSKIISLFYDIMHSQQHISIQHVMYSTCFHTYTLLYLHLLIICLIKSSQRQAELTKEKLIMKMTCKFYT